MRVLAHNSIYSTCDPIACQGVGIPTNIPMEAYNTCDFQGGGGGGG